MGKTLVFGATGNVGYGVAAALLASGAEVVAPTRSAERGEELVAELDHTRLSVVVGDVSDAAGAEELVAAVREKHGPINHVVASIGPWWQKGALHEQPSSEWDRVRTMLLDGHVHAARTWLGPLAEQGGSYTIITGMGAHQPMPGTSLLFTACGGVLSLSRMLREGGAPDGVRVNEVLIAARIEREARHGVVPAIDFGEYVRELLASDVSGEVARFPSP